MSRYVIDASVGIKWFIPEVHSAEAQRLLSGNHELLIPDLFFPEVANILWKRVRRGEDTPEQARATLADFRIVPLQVYASQALTQVALDIAMQMDRTVYDSLYLALAVSTQCQMVTADLKLFNALATGAFAAHVLWVEAVSTA